MAILDNDKHSIGDLFNNRNPFIIPKHQRAYSWEDEEVEAFCDDILEINREYFFGGIVSVYQHAQNAPGRTYRVVDGQQRLATFTLLLAQLREGFKIVESRANTVNDQTSEITAQSLAQDLHENYITYNDTRQRPPQRVNRLTLSKVDKDFFNELLDGQGPTPTAESHRRILHSWNTIFDKLISRIVNDLTLSINEQLDKLQQLKDAVLEHSVIIHIVCDNIDDAYQLFEVLNDRGKELATGDYLRSTTLEILDNNQNSQDRVADIWDHILSRRAAENFIRTYLISHIAVIKRINVHRQFQERFFDYDVIDHTAEREVLNRVINIKEQFDIYELLTDGIWPYQNPTSNSWERNRLHLLINQLDHKLCLPLLLTIYELSTEDDFKRTVLAIEKVVFRYISVSNLRANRLAHLYRSHIIEMRRTGQFIIQDFLNNLRQLISSHCNDAFFEQSIANNLVYKNNNNNRKKIRYFLTTLEDYYRWYTSPNRQLIPRPSMNIITNIDSIDIEHIYPQNANQRNNALEQLKDTIGNLTFWSPNDNRSAGNATFSVKQTFYSQSNVAITRELGNLQNWDDTSVDARKNQYIDIAKLIFSI